MKELDKSKRYDLINLNNEQLNELCNKTKCVSKFIDNGFLMYNERIEDWIITSLLLNPIGTKLKTVCATELFRESESLEEAETYRKPSLFKYLAKRYGFSGK